jgi:proline dehydrogenase
VDLSTRVFRPLVLRLAGVSWFRALATQTPPGRAVAGRFVAGVTLDEAMAAAAELDGGSIRTMLDHLGENVATAAQAEAAAADYLEAIERIAATPSLDAAVSIKLTQLGLDDSIEACRERVLRIVGAAEPRGTLVMIDMEAHPYVDATLEVLREVRDRTDLVGVCLQAYLRRTAADVFSLPEGTRIRLVKGAYLEPPDVVYTRKDRVDAEFAKLFVTLLAREHPIDVATHDPRLIEGVRRRVDAVEGGWARVEFQMLYGVRRDLQARLAADGYPLRVYVPYGTEWYPYLTRRLAERPANVWFFASNLLRAG